LSVTATQSQLSLIEHVAREARAAAVFGNVEVRGQGLSCRAAASAAPAAYRLEHSGERLYVSLVTADRWLSQSVEADLVHTGDSLAELLEEELANLSCPAKATFEHYRSDDKLFTFRTPVPAGRDAADSARMALAFLLGYEACFRNLGDMSAGEDEE
jgi:hypothetical protein